MNEIWMLWVAWIAGLALGAVFFGGLWWTVRKAVLSDYAALWFLGSMLVRTAVTVAGFYLVGGGHWGRLVSCLAGFIVARLAVTRLTRQREAPYAP